MSVPIDLFILERCVLGSRRQRILPGENGVVSLRRCGAKLSVTKRLGEMLATPPRRRKDVSENTVNNRRPWRIVFEGRPLVAERLLPGGAALARSRRGRSGTIPWFPAMWFPANRGFPRERRLPRSASDRTACRPPSHAISARLPSLWGPMPAGSCEIPIKVGFRRNFPAPEGLNTQGTILAGLTVRQLSSPASLLVPKLLHRMHL